MCVSSYSNRLLENTSYRTLHLNTNHVRLLGIREKNIQSIVYNEGKLLAIYSDLCDKTMIRLKDVCVNCTALKQL